MPYLILAGPTASGKSSLAIKLAKAFDGIIVNADSMQWYKDIPTLTAQPSNEDLLASPHYLYGMLDVNDEGSAYLWQKMAVKCIQNTDRLAIVVGGTGLYLRSLTHGLSPVVPIPNEIRLEVRALSKAIDIHEFRTLVFAEDSILAQSSPPYDRQRLARALEVKRATGHSIRSLQGQGIPPLPPALSYIVVSPDKALVRETINRRAVLMFEEKSINEIQTFWAKNPPEKCLLRKAIGLDSITAYINNQLTYESALEFTQIQTRQYAKRQRTWFKGQAPEYAWFNPTFEEISEKIKKTL
ncbi:MAG: tRNA (adenosine(37)-N6)-dimethylallyltransferase MiaA [Candidatus Paracaedibacteraceae bacterium]|nr:tRNA (adenosine(37)-N6)-dimethylallyltransferase MiaA [Candidatus Paracaedibacteraceae bacterium]